MTTFVELVDQKGQRRYINARFIREIRPTKGNDFAGVGATVEIVWGNDGHRTYKVPTGHSSDIVKWVTGK